MRRFLAAALLLVTAAGHASAWCNFSFGIGVGASWQSGGNSFGCGFWNNGAYPCYAGYPAAGYYPVGYPVGPVPAYVPAASNYGVPSGPAGFPAQPFGYTPAMPTFFGWTPQTDFIIRD